MQQLNVSIVVCIGLEQSSDVLILQFKVITSGESDPISKWFPEWYLPELWKHMETHIFLECLPSSWAYLNNL